MKIIITTKIKIGITNFIKFFILLEIFDDFNSKSIVYILSEEDNEDRILFLGNSDFLVVEISSISQK